MCAASSVASGGVLRSVIKFGAPVVAAALALSGCGTMRRRPPSSGGKSASGKACDLKIGFFGALTGDAANLGINMNNGAELAVDQYNEENADCKVTLSSSTRRATRPGPGAGPEGRRRQEVVGIVGPAFSGESEAADPIFDEAGLTIITPSATRPSLAENGWKTFYRGVGNDAIAGPGRRQVHQGRAEGQEGLRHRRPVRVRRGPGRRGQEGPRRRGRRHRQGPAASRPTSPPTSPRSRPRGATALFYGGYYAEAGLLRQAAAGGRLEGHLGRRRRRQGRRLHQGRRRGRRGHRSSPARACHRTKATVRRPTTRRRSTPTRAPTPPWRYDAANIFLEGIEAGKTTRPTCRPS